MTQQQSFKSRVRNRMEKTGESYTTARHHLLIKSDQVESGPETDRSSESAAASMMEQVSEESLVERTGQGWDQWLKLLDDWGAIDRTHTEIARWLVEEHQVDGWWAQAVTVGYEQARGLRVPGQSSDGTFSASASKTINVPVERLFDAFADEAQRSEWLPDAKLSVRTATPHKTFRADWEDDQTRVAVYFVPKGDGKSQVAIQHEKLAGSDDVAEKKAYWRERLADLKKILEA